MWSRGTTLKEQWLLPIGVVVLIVWLGFYAWETLLYAQLITFPQNSVALTEVVATIPVVATTVMILLVGFTIQFVRKRPRPLFVAFVVLEVASLAFSLGATAYFLSTFPPFPPGASYTIYVSLFLASAVSSALGAFLLLVLALPARRLAPLPPAIAPVTPSPPTP
jgi:hypothetical protein